MEWMLMPLRRYAEFSGRSRRKEFWMFTLGIILLYLVMMVVFLVVGGSAILSAGADPGAATGIFASLGMFGLIFGVIMLALIIPSIAVTVRRLHDTDRTGWWLLAPVGVAVVMGVAGQSSATLSTILSLVYLAVAIMLLVFYCLPGTKGPNRFGEDPKGTANAEVFA